MTVREGRSETRHSVIVERTDLERLDPGAGDPSPLVRASIEFLLEREPKESILSRFRVTEIARYFPEYEREIGRRLGRS